jgi:F0F1-type ATP synthase assembly protein I
MMTRVQDQASVENNHRKDVVKGEPQASQKNETSGLGLMVQVTNLAWNLVTPIVGGVLLGHYLDRRTGEDVTWTLSLLVLGVLIAFMNLYELNDEHRHQSLEDEKNGSVAQRVSDEEK